MPPEDVTLVKDTIHNPDEIRHFMKLRPVAKNVRILSGGEVLAETTAALRLMELGHDFYDPPLYIPAEDVTAKLEPVDGKSTHCPLKGDATYFALKGQDGAPIAWCYPDPFTFARDIAGRIAFYADKVTIIEEGRAL